MNHTNILTIALVTLTSAATLGGISVETREHHQLQKKASIYASATPTPTPTPTPGTGGCYAPKEGDDACPETRYTSFFTGNPPTKDLEPTKVTTSKPGEVPAANSCTQSAYMSGTVVWDCPAKMDPNKPKELLKNTVEDNKAKEGNANRGTLINKFEACPEPPKYYKCKKVGNVKPAKYEWREVKEPVPQYVVGEQAKDPKKPLEKRVCGFQKKYEPAKEVKKCKTE